MTNLLKRLSIKQKLLMLFSIQIIIPLIFIGMMLFRSSSEIIQNKSIDYSVDILKMIELRFNDFSNNVEVAAQDLLYDQVIYTLLEDANAKKENSIEQLEVLNASLRKTCLSRDEIQAIALFSNTGKYYAYDANAGRAGIMEQLDYKTIHETAVKGGGKLVWYVEKNQEDDTNNIFAARIIYNINRYEEIGLMVVMIKLEQLEGVYGNLSTEFMERIAIVTQGGDYIIGTGEQSVEHMRQINELDATQVKPYWIDTKQNVLVSYRDVLHPPWRIVTEISLDKLNGDLENFRKYFLIMTAATILIMSSLSFFLAIDIIDPIKRLVSAMSHMKKDKVHEVVIVDRSDELGYLSNCFNDMSEEIDILLNQVYKEQLTRKEAELKTLQAQINPHFLFNTLESINWMARLNEVPEISQMVTALSSLLEAGIGKGGPMITLREELNFVDSYVLIMKNRYGDRLSFNKEVNRECLDIKVPKLMLQPVLENAIYHGIDKNRRNGEIQLSVEKKGGEIAIEVTDNGKGMSTEQLDSLNKQLEDNDDGYLMEQGSHGIGLINVNRRLKLFYGNNFGLRVFSESEAYTKVVMTLPFEASGKGGQEYV